MAGLVPPVAVAFTPVRFERLLVQVLAVPLPALDRPADHIDLHAVFEVLDRIANLLSLTGFPHKFPYP